MPEFPPIDEPAGRLAGAAVLPAADEADAREQDQLAVVDTAPGRLPSSGPALDAGSEFDVLEQSLEVPLDEDDDR
ncbi:MAG: hypothetical protein U0Q15_19785 [Kineosporiaceae bacterium]